jgi:septum formation protein
MPTLILASASPRRAELLRNAGIPFEVEAAKIDESRRKNEPPTECARRLAAEKARAVFKKRPEDFVLGADTIVVVDEQVLEKPRDADDAAHMLKLLSGRRHLVTTGVCLLGPAQVSSFGFQVSNARSETRNSKLETSFEDIRHETTEVFFSPLSEADVRWYVETGEPMDKAGAYGIQGAASRWVEKIVGCYFNVVGLPVPLVWKMLKEGSLRVSGFEFQVTSGNLKLET